MSQHAGDVDWQSVNFSPIQQTTYYTAMQLSTFISGTLQNRGVDPLTFKYTKQEVKGAQYVLLKVD